MWSCWFCIFTFLEPQSINIHELNLAIGEFIHYLTSSHLPLFAFHKIRITVCCDLIAPAPGYNLEVFFPFLYCFTEIISVHLHCLKVDGTILYYLTIQWAIPENITFLIWFMVSGWTACIDWSYAIFIQIDKYYGDATGAGRHSNGSRGGIAHFGRAQGSQRKERKEKDCALFSLPQGTLHRSQVRSGLLRLQWSHVSLKNVCTGKLHTKQYFTVDKL